MRKELINNHEIKKDNLENQKKQDAQILEFEFNFFDQNYGLIKENYMDSVPNSEQLVEWGKLDLYMYNALSLSMRKLNQINSRGGSIKSGYISGEGNYLEKFMDKMGLIEINPKEDGNYAEFKLTTEGENLAKKYEVLLNKENEIHLTGEPW